MVGRCPSLINERGDLGTDKSVPYNSSRHLPHPKLTNARISWRTDLKTRTNESAKIRQIRENPRAMPLKSACRALLLHIYPQNSA
ncbi:MAG: hypothetical protein FWG87_01330 [Defluviitaleaceae bacterium]|nr:hypothetical protein [Defluviitaleaceae bacterium]